MIVVKNKIIPPSGVKAMAFWPWLFVRAKYMSERDMRHEEIHGCQQRELLLVAVVLRVVSGLSGLGWFYKCIVYRYAKHKLNYSLIASTLSKGLVSKYLLLRHFSFIA